MVLILMVELKINWKYERCQFSQEEMKNKRIELYLLVIKVERKKYRVVIIKVSYDFMEIY